MPEEFIAFGKLWGKKRTRAKKEKVQEQEELYHYFNTPYSQAITWDRSTTDTYTVYVNSPNTGYDPQLYQTYTMGSITYSPSTTPITTISFNGSMPATVSDFDEITSSYLAREL